MRNLASYYTKLGKEDKALELENSTWEPKNYGHEEGGPTRLREALAKSKVSDNYVVKFIEPSIEKQGYFNVTLGCITTEKTYIITVSMKNSLEQLLNSLNLALETLTNR